MFFDASGVGLGAMAFQDGRPISVLSRGLAPAEKNYTTTERELLAVVWATKKWVTMIESTRAPIYVYTDHKLLTQNWNADYRNRRMNRWLLHFMQLPVQYKYVIGENNPADAPSRRHGISRRKTNLRLVPRLDTRGEELHDNGERAAGDRLGNQKMGHDD